jgi:hypothetical protein
MHNTYERTHADAQAHANADTHAREDADARAPTHTPTSHALALHANRLFRFPRIFVWGA